MRDKIVILLILLTFYINGEATETSEYQKINDKFKIIKCCPINKVRDYYNLTCINTNITMPNVPVYSYNENMVTKRNLTKYFNVVVASTHGAFPINVESFVYSLMEDGSLNLSAPNTDISPQKNGTFCYDFKLNGTELTPTFWLDESEDENEGQSLTDFTTGVMFTSCFFLFLVLVVYLITEETRNLIGLTIMAYVFCFLNGLFVLAYSRTSQFIRLVCTLFTYYIYFFVLASFCWMNIISYDIWAMSRSYTQNHSLNRRRKWIQFLRYAAYAFGVPTMLTVFLYVMDNVDQQRLPKWFVTPRLESATCFFSGYSRFFYFYVPMLVIILCNIVFYVLTGCSLRNHYKETSMLNRNGDRGVTRRQRQRLWMFIKLSVVMGVNWVFEVISALNSDWGGWFITDNYNLLVGVAIFFIFVFKKKTLTKLKKKLRFIGTNDVHGRKNRNDSYTMSSHEESFHLSPNADGQSKSFQTVSI